MNRLTLRITVGLLVAVVMATLGVQFFLSWRLNRAISAERIDQVCIETGSVSLGERNRLLAMFERASVPAPAGHRPGPATTTSPPAAQRKISFRSPLDPLPWTTVLALLAGVAAFVMSAGFLLTHPVLKRLRSLDVAAERIAAGELGARAPVSGQDPITQFALHFNQMAERNQRLLEGQRHLLQAVSHELRTPAARIRFGLEMLRETENEDAKERYRAGIDADVDEIDALVEELLALNRLDSSGIKIEGQHVDAIAVVRDECNTLSPLRPDVEFLLPAPTDGGIWIYGSERLFRRVIRNLLSNALRHARHRVTMTVTTQAEGMRLCIDDDGPGVPVADRARIFEPFTRLDGSRSRESGGFGLGLAIVERIVRAHNGSIAVKDAPGGGARFVLSWSAGPLHV